jgi:hypothetical protein
VLGIEGFIAYFSAVHGVWLGTGVALFFMLVVIAGVLRAATKGRG